MPNDTGTEADKSETVVEEVEQEETQADIDYKALLEKKEQELRAAVVETPTEYAPVFVAALIRCLSELSAMSVMIAVNEKVG